MEPIDLGHGLRLYLQDPACPLLEFTDIGGRHAGFNILALAEQRGPMTGGIVRQWLQEQIAIAKAEGGE